jgi:hypothetical protein
MLDERMQKGYLEAAADSIDRGFASQERASELVEDAAERINQCPAYVRQAVKMLTKAVHEHDKNSRIIDG